LLGVGLHEVPYQEYRPMALFNYIVCKDTTVQYLYRTTGSIVPLYGSEMGCDGEVRQAT